MKKLKKFFQNKGSWLTASTAIISAILGIVAGPIIEAFSPPLFQGSNLLYLTFFISSILFVIVSTYAITIWNHDSKQIDSIYEKIRELAKSLDVKFTFKPIGKGNSDAIYKHVTEMINLAEREILILNYGTTRKAKDHLAFDKEIFESSERQRYYDVMLQKIQASEKGSFKFRRIVQIPNNTKEWVEAGDTSIIKHYKLLAQIGSKSPEFASLKKSSPFFDTTFMVIDKRYVILAMDVLDPEGKEYYTMGHLVFDDPIGDFAREFSRLFDRIDANATLVKPSDLAKF